MLPMLWSRLSYSIEFASALLCLESHNFCSISISFPVDLFLRFYFTTRIPCSVLGVASDNNFFSLDIPKQATDVRKFWNFLQWCFGDHLSCSFLLSGVLLWLTGTFKIQCRNDLYITVSVSHLIPLCGKDHKKLTNVSIVAFSSVNFNKINLFRNMERAIRGVWGFFELC